MTARKWTEEMVEEGLRSAAAVLGRMPASRDLIAMGRNDLSVQVHRRGPKSWRGWAERIGADQRDSCTKFGTQHEDEVEALLISMGHRTERQSARHPFDILVNGHCRIDVKAAHWHSYTAPGGAICAGYFCGLKNVPPRCDMFVICCADGAQAGDLYFIPSAEVPIRAITVTPNGKYSRFRNAIDVLTFALLEEAA